jgi:hypothetical protein
MLPKLKIVLEEQTMITGCGTRNSFTRTNHDNRIWSADFVDAI